jgi:hypothetical protein
MALTIIGAYRPPAASTARTSANLSTIAIATCAVYARFIATVVGGSLFGPGGGRTWAIGGTAAGDQMGLFRSFTGAGILVDDLNNPSVSTTTGDLNPSASAGDLIETFTQLDVSAKTINLSLSKNGAAPTSATTGTLGGSLSASWGNGAGSPVLYINQTNGAGFGDQSILAVCYATGTPTLANFRDWYNTVPEVLGDRPHSPQHMAVLAY